MAGAQEKWYFTKEQLQNSPSRKCGLDADKELAYRQQAANLIQDMGQRLQVSQLCINTAIVYMHRFYAFHSFTQFHRNAIAAASLFLAAKVEEQPRKLEYVIKVAHVCLHGGEGVDALSSEQYQEQAQDLVFNENVLLQTLGFDVAIDHPHTHVVRTCHLVKAPKDLAQTSYFVASNSLHLTTMCLQYRPTVVACFCIHLASKWSNWAMPQSNEGRHWFSCVDGSVTVDLLEKLTAEFLLIFEKCPSRLKRKMMNVKQADGSSPHSNAALPSGSAAAPSPFDKKHVLPTNDDFDKSFDKEYERERRRQAVPGGYVPATTAPPPQQPAPQKIDYNLYKEKREREERERRDERERRALQRPGAPPRPTPQPPHSRPHHKPPWPPHKPHQKPHDHRHHRPVPGISQERIDVPQVRERNDLQSREGREVPRAEVRSELTRADARSELSRLDLSRSESRSELPRTEVRSELSRTEMRTEVRSEVPQRTRPPSLFSPDNTMTPAAAAAPRKSHPPPRPKPERPLTLERPQSPRKRPDTATALREMQQPAILSPFSSPQEVKSRQRHHSDSEPELVPVVKKIDETPGYENVIRDSQRGGSIRTKQPERKEMPVRTLNGIETDPTLVSYLLKESLAKPAPITVATEKKSPIEIKREIVEEPKPQPQPPQPEPAAQPTEEAEHKHKKEKKKKEKHKHKDRDKSKEERKKHKKDKDKKSPVQIEQPPAAPPQQDGIRITIPREKLSSTSPGLKIKIPKERLAAPPPPPQSSSLKIKISKEVLETSRKRAPGAEPGPPAKLQRQNGAPHPKVGPWNVPPPFRPPLPYYVCQPPPPLYYGIGMDGFFYGMDGGYMYQPPPQPQPQPPLPAVPPPPVPPPPPE